MGPIGHVVCSGVAAITAGSPDGTSTACNALGAVVSIQLASRIRKYGLVIDTSAR